MKKADLIYAVAFRRFNRAPSKEDLATASLAVSNLLDQITEKVAKDGRVEVREFGSFTQRVWNNRFRRNPVTGESWRGGRQMNLKFKPSPKLNARLSKKK